MRGLCLEAEPMGRNNGNTKVKRGNRKCPKIELSNPRFRNCGFWEGMSKNLTEVRKSQKLAWRIARSEGRVLMTEEVKIEGG